MLAQEYLTLKLIRLKPPEEWAHECEGLSFVFPKGGTGKYIAAKIAQRLAPGDVLLLSEADRGKVCLANGGDMVFWAFSLCLEHLFPLFASNEIALLQTVAEGLKGPRFYQATNPLAVECHRLVAGVPPQFNLDHRSQLLRVAAALLSSEFKAAHGQRIGFVRVEEHMLQVFEKLSSDELLNLSVGELAARFSCSRRHLNRLFHQYFGFSVAALRMEMRLIKAVSLLRDPDAKVINVAERCGFNHLGLFNTCFKRRFGTSPGQWRKSAALGEKPMGGSSGNEKDCPLHSNGLCPWSGKTHTGIPMPAKDLPFQRPGPAGASPGVSAADGGAEKQAMAIHEALSREDLQRALFQSRA